MTRRTTAPRSKAERIDVYKKVTGQIVAMLEVSTRPWSLAGRRARRPFRSAMRHRLSWRKRAAPVVGRHDAGLRSIG